MEAKRLSPFTRQVCGIPGKGKKRLPSMRSASGFELSPRIALCMAMKVAFKILNRSISGASKDATDHEMASFSTTSRRWSRCPAVNFLESFKRGWKKSGGSMTAAVKTGPARQPLPASSHPASTFPLVNQGCKGITQSMSTKDNLNWALQSILSAYF